MASLIPDSIKDTLGDLIGTWGDIQQIQLKKKLVETQNALNMAGAAYITPEMAAQNAGYRAVEGTSTTNTVLVIGAVVVGLGALFMLASK